MASWHEKVSYILSPFMLPSFHKIWIIDFRFILLFLQTKFILLPDSRVRFILHLVSHMTFLLRSEINFSKLYVSMRAQIEHMILSLMHVIAKDILSHREDDSDI
jgi:hypothetical protein